MVQYDTPKNISPIDIRGTIPLKMSNHIGLQSKQLTPKLERPHVNQTITDTSQSKHFGPAGPISGAVASFIRNVVPTELVGQSYGNGARRQNINQSMTPVNTTMPDNIYTN
jgi:hypothetical protein